MRRRNDTVVLHPATPVAVEPSLRLKDETDPWRRAVELAQRARMTIDVSAADLEFAEARYGPFHETTWYFRNAISEARLAWERLRAEIGSKTLEAALKEPPITVLTLEPTVAAGDSPDRTLPIVLVPIGGQTYQVQRIPGTDPAPVQWRIIRLHPPLKDGPYFACRLEDGSTQCDCADWTYQLNPTGPGAPACKHLKALAALGWI